jgi:hypothetical protein
MFGYIKAIAYRYGFSPSQLKKYKNIKNQPPRANFDCV